jgi:phosphoglycerate dehydrogenase-like enzyme
MNPPVVAFLSDSPKQIARVYGAESRARLRQFSELREDVLTSADLRKARDVSYLFSTWGMPRVEERVWRSLPQMKAVFYAAGSVKAFAEPLLASGLRLFSAWEANAQPVAEYCLAQILLAGKGFLPSTVRLSKDGRPAWSSSLARGNRGTVVSLLGAGKVGQALIRLMRPFPMKVLVFDPFLTDDAARTLGVERVTLEAAFARGQVVSNHLADVPETRGLIGSRLLSSMVPNALFVNTGRGATVDEKALWEVLRGRPDLYAVLDVTDPEPPVSGSPAYSLPNVFLSPHVAGSLGSELEDMALAMTDELAALLTGRELRAEVTASMLTTMA